MAKTLSRRDFLKLGGAGAAALAAGQFIPPQVAQAARASRACSTPQGDGYIPSMCEMCVWRCGLLAKVEDGRVVKLEGNPEHPHSRGKLCPRGQSGLMNTYDPDRVLTPLIRVGKRGEGKFRKASWEEALDLVASKMLEIKEKYGAGGDGLLVHAQPVPGAVREPAVCLWFAQLRHAAQPVLQCHDHCLLADLWH